MEIFLINFLPIFIIFLLVSYTNIFADVSNTILGKLFAIILILFYSKQDKLIGLFVCLLVIYYYQTDFIGSLDWLNKSFENTPSKSVLQPAETNSIGHDKPIIENMFDYGVELSDAYTLKSISNDMNQRKTKFRNENCHKGQLMYKGQSIKNENAEHIFPEIKQDEFNKCNLCDPSCDFSFINKHIDMEEVLVKPKDSNDWILVVWENMISSHK